MNVKKKRSGVLASVLSKFFIFLITLIILVLITALCLLGSIYHSPSPAFKDAFALSMMETSAMHFLVEWFLPPEEVQRILNQNKIDDTTVISDPELVKIVIGDDSHAGDDEHGNSGDPSGGTKKLFEYNSDGIAVIEVTGKTYRGKMMIVRDPARVFIGTPKAYGTGAGGMTLSDMVTTTGSVAGINGGGFYDPGKVSALDGDVPTGINNSPGIVIKDSKIMYGKADYKYDIIGISKDNVLIVGKMTGKDALGMGVREALNFGPSLIINGAACKVEGASSGLNPRTAIGQRADGAMMLLVIDGRQASSLGATYEDLITVFMKYGAVNAANLDGGQSSMMIYNGDVITTPATLYKPRKMSTCILVKG